MTDADQAQPPASQDSADDTAEIIVSAPRAARRARWVETVFLAALAVYAVLALLARLYSYFEWDLAVARAVQSIALPGFRGAMVAVSTIGYGLVPSILVALTAVTLIAVRLRLEGAMLIAGTASGWLINQSIKIFIARPRPTDELVQVARIHHSQSFPSGHVVFYVEFFGFLFFLAYVLLERGGLRRASLALLALPILLIGVSRVYLGAHWPSDALGAYLAGGMWLMVVIEGYRRMAEKKN